MERLRMIDPQDWDPQLKAAVNPDERTDLENGLMRFFAHRPELALGLGAFGGALKRNRQLPERLMELMRLRIAFHNQCRSCMAIRYPDAIEAGLYETLVCSLERPQDAPDLTDAERAALAFADKFATDHWAIGHGDYEALRVNFSEPQLVELGLLCALCLGVGRLARTWDMTAELPDAFRQGAERIGPWQGEPVVVAGRRPK